MMDMKKRPTSFDEQSDEDKDMTMFVMTNLILTKDQNANMVYMALWLKRKPAMELLTTFLTTILLQSWDRWNIDVAVDIGVGAVLQGKLDMQGHPYLGDGEGGAGVLLAVAGSLMRE